MTLAITNNQNNPKANNFDFIRFCAAVAVVFSHSFDITGSNINEPVRKLTKAHFSVGSLAVIVFFIISGYLISKSYQGVKSLRVYLKARILRIYPGLVVVILVSVFILGPIFSGDPAAQYFADQKTHIYLLNCFSFKIYYLLPGLFSTNKVAGIVNASLWSLPYEISCYILVGGIGELLKKKYLKTAIMLAVLTCLYIAIGFSLIVNILIYTYYFICGAAMYTFKDKIKLNQNPLIIIILTLLFLTIIHFNINDYVTELIIGPLLSYIIIDIAHIKSALKGFGKYGDFSYGIYVWGWPVQQVLSMKFVNMNHYMNFFSGILITMLLAFFSWHIIEKRALRLKSSIR